eukprot:7653-Pyramimonas_sp.AAC.1
MAGAAGEGSLMGAHGLDDLSLTGMDMLDHWGRGQSRDAAASALVATPGGVLATPRGGGMSARGLSSQSGIPATAAYAPSPDTDSRYAAPDCVVRVGGGVCDARVRHGHIRRREELTGKLYFRVVRWRNKVLTVNSTASVSSPT